MPTTITRYVNTASPAGGNGTTNSTTAGDANRAYASFTTALDTEYGVTPNLVTSDSILKIICEGTAADPASWAYYIPNFTTDSTRYIWIYVDPSKRWQGKYDTTKYRLENNSSIYMILLGSGHLSAKIVWEGVQWKHTTSNNTYSRITYYHQGMSSPTLMEFRDCLFNNIGISGTAGITFFYAAGVTNKSVSFVNCVAAGKWDQWVSYPYANSGRAIYYNNTFSGSTNYHGWFGNTDATLAFKNNIFISRNGYIVGGGGPTNGQQQRIWNTINNITNINDGPEVSLRNQTIKFIDPANADLRIHPDSYNLVRWKGANLTNDPFYPFSTDANNNSRNDSVTSDGWDIGAFQVSPTQSVATPFKKVYQYIGATDTYVDKRVDAAVSASNYLIDGPSVYGE